MPQPGVTSNGRQTGTPDIESAVSVRRLCFAPRYLARQFGISKIPWRLRDFASVAHVVLIAWIIPHSFEKKRVSDMDSHGKGLFVLYALAKTGGVGFYAYAVPLVLAIVLKRHSWLGRGALEQILSLGDLQDEHRWLGLRLVTSLSFHMACHLVHAGAAGVEDLHALVSSKAGITGFIAMSAMILVSFLARLPHDVKVRVATYEVRQATHSVLALAMFALMIVHLELPRLQAVASLLVATVVGGWLATLQMTRKVEVWLDACQEGTILKMLRKDLPAHFRVGGVLTLRMPELSQFQTHSFSSFDSDDGMICCYAAKAGSFTSRLNEMANKGALMRRNEVFVGIMVVPRHDESKTDGVVPGLNETRDSSDGTDEADTVEGLPAVDPPEGLPVRQAGVYRTGFVFGDIASPTLSTQILASSVVAVATGNGIPAILGFISRYTDRKNIRVLWKANSEAEVGALLGLYRARQAMLRMDVFIRAPNKSEELLEGFQGVKIVRMPGHPDLPQLARKLVDEGGSEWAIVYCGKVEKVDVGLKKFAKERQLQYLAEVGFDTL